MVPINLVPHPITYSAIIDGRPQMITLPPEPAACRVQTESHDLGMLGHLPIQKQTFGEIHNLPDPIDGVVYVVSGIVLAALKAEGSTRHDIIAPATGPRDNPMRNADGQVLAVSRFNALSMPQESAA